MKLKRKKCNINIKLTPYGADFLQVIFDICGDHHVFYPSATMGFQFAQFLDALYYLYDEGTDNHRLFRYSIKTKDEVSFTDVSVPEGCIRKVAEFDWDQEGRCVDLCFERTGRWNCPVLELGESDQIRIRLVTHYSVETVYEYYVDGRDLCYAVAKACTKALKTYGIWGYYRSSACDINEGDHLNLGHLLFIKAYALDVMEVRELKQRWKHPRRLWPGAEYTSFNKEIELLLFDM